MTYKSAISMFRSRYLRLSISEAKPYPKMTDTEILMEMSVIQSELQNKYMIVDKNSQANSTAQTTLTVGDDTYTAGTTAGTIPLDLWQIWNVQINDTTNRTLTQTGREYMENRVKGTGIPMYYTVYKQAGNQVLELDTLPNSAYLMNIFYSPSFDIYQGVGQTSVTWSDVDFTASGYGGSLKIVGWEHIIVAGALANATGNERMRKQYNSEVQEMLRYQPSNTGTDIPYCDVTLKSSNRYWLPVGYDLPQYY